MDYPSSSHVLAQAAAASTALSADENKRKERLRSSCEGVEIDH